MTQEEMLEWERAEKRMDIIGQNGPTGDHYAELHVIDVEDADNSVDTTLEERGNRYGKFKDQSFIAQRLKADMQSTPNWVSLHSDQKEALEMIQHKIARILNGDPDYSDSWHDIAGYAQLVEKRLNGVEG